MEGARRVSGGPASRFAKKKMYDVAQTWYVVRFNYHSLSGVRRVDIVQYSILLHIYDGNPSMMT